MTSGDTTTKILRHRTPHHPRRRQLDRLPEIGRPKLPLRPPLMAPTTTLDWDDDPTLTQLDEPDPVPEPTIHERRRSQTRVLPRMQETTIPVSEAPTVEDGRWFMPVTVAGAILTMILSIAI